MSSGFAPSNTVMLVCETGRAASKALLLVRLKKSHRRPHDDEFMEMVMFLWHLCLCRAARSGADHMQAMREGGFHGAALHASAAEPPESSSETSV